MRQCLSDKPLYPVNYEYPTHQGMVLDGLNTLRQKSKLIDVTLIVEGQSFDAHKVVLSACSDYFRAMFTDNMLEARKNEICLNGITAQGFYLVLEYAYTCKITLNLANVQDVLEAASHVQMLALIQTCSNYLEAEIDTDNCVDIVTIAETYSLPMLKLKVYRFMSQNLLAFSNTTEFYRLTAQQLETILEYDFTVDCSEVDVFRIVLSWFFHSENAKLNIQISTALRIINHIHFKEISMRKLNTLLTKMFDNTKLEWLYKIILNEVYSQMNSQKNKIIPNLLNSRGMDLAIVKIGGFGISGITNEITYTFASKCPKWKHLTSIPHVEQCNFGTAVLNNELFIVGGCFNQSLQENIHPFGFKFSPQLNKWSTMAPMQIERCRFSLNVVGPMLYAVGGASEVDEYDTSTCEYYNPLQDTWHMIQPLPAYLSQHAGASFEKNGVCKLFISGGMDRDTVQSSMYCYDVRLATWQPCAQMPTPRADHVMLTIGSLLYVCGGWREDPETRLRLLVPTIDVFNIENDSWESVTQIPTPRYHAGIVGVHNKIYIIGGFHSDAMFDRDTAVIECYDIETNSWTTEDKYPQEIWEHTCVTLYIPKFRDDMDVISSNGSAL